jgi:putative ABC transport system permease protein
VTIDGRVLGFAAVVSLLTGVLFGLAPAAGTKYNADEPVRQFYQAVSERVSKLPGVEAAGLVSNLPFSGNYDRNGFHIEEKPLPNPAEAPSVERYGITPDYLRTMRIPLLRGRGFSEQDNANAPLVVLISQTTAQRFWPHEDPLGKRVRLGAEDGKLRTIVGIVPDVLHKRLEDGPDIQAYVPHAQWVDGFMLLAVRTTADPAGAIAAIRQAVSAVDKDIPISQIATMEQLVATTTAQRRFTMLLAGVFAGLSLLLAGLGIYSVIAYTVAQRTHEIGIRMALGAQMRDVLRLVLRQGMKLALVGVGVGLLASFGLTRLMQKLLFGVSATDPLTFTGIALLLTFVALLACWIPARRATKVDPMVALRTE